MRIPSRNQLGSGTSRTKSPSGHRRNRSGTSDRQVSHAASTPDVPRRAVFGSTSAVSSRPLTGLTASLTALPSAPRISTSVPGHS
jgi:hypothetical protein